jgi:ribosomal-protein-serine acetyltransferase
MEPLTLPDLTDVSFRIDDEVYLRRFVVEDAPSVYEAVRRNIDHLHFMHWITPDYSLEMAREFIGRATLPVEAKKGLGFGIFRGDRFIGSIGYVSFELDTHRTEIGYWLDKDEEGKGIISASVRKMIDFAFNELRMNKVEIRCSADNIRSAAVPRRLGFKEEGLLRQSELRHGVLKDFMVFGLLRDEWPRVQPA